MDSRRTFFIQLVALVAALGLLPGCREAAEKAIDAPPVVPELLGSPLPQFEPLLRVRIHRARGDGAVITLGAKDQPLHVEHLG